MATGDPYKGVYVTFTFDETAIQQILAYNNTKSITITTSGDFTLAEDHECKCTITLNSGYEITTVDCDGTILEVVDNQFTFTVSGNGGEIITITTKAVETDTDTDDEQNESSGGVL